MEDPKFYAPLKKSAGSKENIVVGSYLQSYKYFQAQQLDIRRIFTFKDSVQARVRKWFEGTLRGQRASKFVVGIHVRGGDHSGKSNWQPFLRMPPDKWYKARMDHLREQHKNVVFVVCSDDHKLGTPTLSRVLSFCARRCYQLGSSRVSGAAQSSPAPRSVAGTSWCRAPSARTWTWPLWRPATP